jgi:hypothetical protein
MAIPRQSELILVTFFSSRHKSLTRRSIRLPQQTAQSPSADAGPGVL